MNIKKRNIINEIQHTKYTSPDTSTKTPGLHFFILGFGRFGQLALRRLERAFPSAKFTVVDEQPGILDQIHDNSVESLAMDGITALISKVPEMEASDWIIPAIPRHVAYEWMRQQLQNIQEIETLKISDGILKQLPNPVGGDDEAIYASIADFICPDDCLEPETICTCTGKPRPVTLNEALTRLQHSNFQPIVIHSRQLAPGVGGYQVFDLESALIEVTKNPGPFLVATACKCHGVIQAFRLIPTADRV